MENTIDLNWIVCSKKSLQINISKKVGSPPDGRRIVSRLSLSPLSVIKSNYYFLNAQCVFGSISSLHEPLEVSKHEWYPVVINCLGPALMHNPSYIVKLLCKCQWRVVRELYKSFTRGLWEFYKSCTRVARELYESCTRVARQLFESCTRVVRELYESRTRAVWEPYESCMRAAWELYESCTIVIWELFKSCTRVVQELYESYLKVVRESFESKPC